MDYNFLIDLGLIILFVQFFYLIIPRLHLPKLLAGILAGIILGPALLGIIQPSETIDIFSELAVIFIMFYVGMHTSLRKFLLKTKNFVVIAVLGVVVPFICAMIFSTSYTHNYSLNLFFGAVITATSVSMTVQTLIDLKKFNTNVGLAILGASFLNDIIGVIFLSIIMNGGNISLLSLGTLAYNSVLFIVVSAIIGFLLFNAFAFLRSHNWLKKNIHIFAISFCLIFAYFAEYLGLSGIVGAYIVGLIIGTTKQARVISNKVDTLVTAFFDPIFAASIGLQVATLSLSPHSWVFIAIFTMVVIISKILGNGIGAYLCDYKKRESLQIGFGMATGGEISFIMIDEALNLGLINEEFFSIILLTVLAVTIIAPILLHISFYVSDKLNSTKAVKA